MDGTGLYNLKPSDIARASAVLFEAFRDDPFFEYMLDARRHELGVAASVHAFTLKMGIRYGRAYAPSADVEGVAIWLPPGGTRITAWRSLRSGVLRLGGTLSKNRKELWSFARRMLRYSAYSDALHERNAPVAHWYLLSIGIGDRWRGKGYASVLLKPMLWQCDHTGTPCYLETHNPRNVGLYEHFGFVVKEESRLPGSDRMHWAMLRGPQ